MKAGISLARKLGNARSIGVWQASLAGLAIMRGDRTSARKLFEESLAIHRSLDDSWGVSVSLSSLACLALEAGDAEIARAFLAEALAIAREKETRLADTLEMSARLAATDGRPTLAIRLYARAALHREAQGEQTLQVGWPDVTPDTGDLRSSVGDENFEEQWARGRLMGLIEAIDQAASEPHRPSASTV